MTCSAYNSPQGRTPDEEVLIRAVRAAAVTYASYIKWHAGDPIIKGWNLHRERRHLEIYGALYRVSRRQTIMFRYWKGMHP